MRELHICDSVGKTVRGVVMTKGGGSIVVAFTDGTVSVITISEARGFAELVCDFFYKRDYTDGELAKLGVITKDELAAIRSKRKEIRRAKRLQANEARDARERAQYDRLRAKFGG